MKREYLLRFYIAGFSYYEGCIAMKDLEVGKKLKLKAKPKNQYDKNAVAIYYKEMKLGYVPKTDNQLISKFLLFGYDMFEARIQRIDTSKNSEHQVGVIVYLVKK